MRSTLFAFGVALGALPLGCSSEETRQLDPTAIAMTDATAPAYDDGEITLYEVYTEVSLPVRTPTASERQALSGQVGPFDHEPWVTPDNLGVQVTWTLANLDPTDHSVRVLVDPWNEFGRYVPGFAQDGDDTVPNLSGIDEAYDLPGLGTGRPSRRTHVFSYDDMKELAVDFATAINIIQSVAPPAADSGEDDPRVGLVNHAFAVGNRSGEDPLTDAYVPGAIPGLLGFRLGLRTAEPANIAIEFVVEVVDRDGERMLDEDSREPALSAPATTFTVGTG